MLLLLNTSQPTCQISLINDDKFIRDEWQAGRELAHGLLGRINNLLISNGKSWNDITGIGAFQGPGSFTGLRIGLTVLNTIADANSVPIVSGRGPNWESEVIEKLKQGKNEKIVLPYYDRDANITTPRK